MVPIMAGNEETSPLIYCNDALRGWRRAPKGCRHTIRALMGRRTSNTLKSFSISALFSDWSQRYSECLMGI